MMSKLGHLVFVCIGSYPLCLDVNFHLRILKIGLETFLQVKIKFLCEKLVYVSTHKVFQVDTQKPMFRMCQHKRFFKLTH